MYTISTSIELPIAHCLYRGAYSGLCCGNVYRNKGQNDTYNDRYDLKDSVFPIVHGHNYVVTVDVMSNRLDENKMVIDFKLFKKLLHNYFDQYDHSLILTPDNPLCKAYINNFKENNIDYMNTRLFIWAENPTAEYMAKYWTKELEKVFQDNNFNILGLKITVEETSHNKVTYEDRV